MNPTPTLYCDFTKNSQPIQAGIAIAYSGGANGTRFNENGLIAAASAPRIDYDPATARTLNYIKNSDQLDLAIWAKAACSVVANAIQAPDGSFTAEKIVEGTANSQHLVTQNIALPAGNTVWSFYAKAAERTKIQLNRSDIGGFAFAVDLTTGIISILAGFTNAKAELIGNGWWRLSAVLNLTSPATVAFGSQPLDASGTAVYAGDGVSGFYGWGYQIEDGITLSKYTSTVNAIVNSIPTPIGLLIEEARTNLALQSAALDDVAWTKTRMSVSANVIVSPDGGVNADKLVEDASVTNSHLIAVANWTSTLAPYTISCWGKAGERTKFQLGISGSHLSTGANARFTFVGAGLAENLNNMTSVNITAYPNGWYRCTATFTPDLVATAPSFIYILDVSGNNVYTGDGTSGIYAWGMQIELGGAVSSYIPTVAASVTRTQDQANSPLPFPGFNDKEGTLYTEFAFTEATKGGNNIPVSMSQGTSAESIALRRISTIAIRQQVRSVAGGLADIDIINNTSLIAGFVYKCTMGYKINQQVSCINILTGAPITGAGTWASTNAWNILRLGDGAGVLDGPFNGWLKKLVYYPWLLPEQAHITVTK